MQALHRLGLKSATDVAGAGWLPTYPANRRIPPLLPIDHVLINEDLTATSVTSFALSGSDHRGLACHPRRHRLTGWLSSSLSSDKQRGRRQRSWTRQPLLTHHDADQLGRADDHLGNVAAGQGA